MSATLEPPRYTILGGPNGVGKSTIFARLTEWGYRSGAFLNPDEIAKELNGAEPARAVAAGRETLRCSRAWMASRRSFVRESTLSSREIVRSAEAARDAGYRVTLIFVGLSKLSTTKNRVWIRSRSGGHAIPVRDQERRFLRAFDNAPRVAALADEAYFLDNGSGQPWTVAVVHRGIVLFRGTARAAWVERATEGLAPAHPMWDRETALEWVRMAEDMSDELREEHGSYRAESSTSGPAVAIHADLRRITAPPSGGHPGLSALMRATPMETTLERLRERAEEVVRQAPAIEAVVLFGSRARGTAGPGSDWDIALIAKSGKTPEAAYRLFGELPGVRLLGFRAGEIERHKDTAGALEAALARQGITLAGAWRRPACRKEALSMDVVRMRANLDNATDAVTRAVMAGIDHLHARGRKRSDWTPVTTGSVDAAEHVAKAVLTGYGLSPREVHFLDALAEQLATAYRGRNDPRQAQWAERIRAMNGTTRTRRLHDADYRRFVAPPAEPLERSVERTGQAQRTQILWLQEMVERWPEHAEEIMDATREIADKDDGLSGWRASYANKVVTADKCTRKTITSLEESTAEWIGSAKALLAGLEVDGRQ